MRTFIISGGPEGLQRIEFEDKDLGLFTRAVEGDVERHNAVSSVENRWVWGEEGTLNDPQIAPTEE